MKGIIHFGAAVVTGGRRWIAICESDGPRGRSLRSWTGSGPKTCVRIRYCSSCVDHKKDCKKGRLSGVGSGCALYGGCITAIEYPVRRHLSVEGIQGVQALCIGVTS